MPAPSVDLDSFGTAVRVGRKARGLSQQELAHDLGIAQSYLSALEQGRSVPGAALILSIARALDLDSATLLEAAAARSSAA